jgi:hypothetical protein
MRGLLLALSIASAPVSAVECAVPGGAAPSLRSISAADRLGFVRRGLAASARKDRIWSYTWMALYGAAASAELALIPVTAPEARIDNYAVAGTSFLGFAAQLVLPLHTIADQRRLEARLRGSPATADPCAQLADAERVLARAAESEEKAQGPLLHALNFVVNIAAGVIVGLVGGRWPNALVQIFVGSAVGETTIITQPIDSVRLAERYRRGDLTERRAVAPFHFAITPFATRDQRGLVLQLTF